ncbi:MAG: hypothetical protein Q8O68_00795 [Candidatus Daviesbacteria bacterium]|nr:hypothetical protein [Candidatus Daviesbacteria bacterium]
MAKTLGFAHLPSPHGGRGGVMAWGTVASVVSGGSFAVSLDTGGSVQLRNVLAPQVSVLNSVYGTAAVLEVVGSTNGYITVTIWDAGTGELAVNAGTVDLNFLAIGGGGSI